MRVRVTIEEGEIENEEGRLQASILVTCERCDHTATCFGTGPASVKRAAAQLRETCPRGEENFYTPEEQ